MPSRIRTAAAALLVLTPAMAQEPAPSVWDGVYTDEQAERGRQIYASTCLACHGESLAGIESAPALTGELFNANWSGTTVADLSERIRISMPVDKPGSLSRAQLAGVIAYIFKVGGFPAGERPLDPQALGFSPIRILSNKPD